LQLPPFFVKNKSNSNIIWLLINTLDNYIK
jgi:hypothetical protein